MGFWDPWVAAEILSRAALEIRVLLLQFHMGGCENPWVASLIPHGGFRDREVIAEIPHGGLRKSVLLLQSHMGGSLNREVVAEIPHGALWDREVITEIPHGGPLDLIRCGSSAVVLKA